MCAYVCVVCVCFLYSCACMGTCLRVGKFTLNTGYSRELAWRLRLHRAVSRQQQPGRDPGYHGAHNATGHRGRQGKLPQRQPSGHSGGRASTGVKMRTPPVGELASGAQQTIGPCPGDERHRGRQAPRQRSQHWGSAHIPSE